jgi:3-hydroxyisobutyrate dehydrogenase-like beta-hydroxyacid dehydrogenase
MAKLGFLGLGIMGGPMAKRLLGAGQTLPKHDSRQSAAGLQ